MDFRAYFESTAGVGVLATADSAGKVDAAVYSRPHVMEDGNLAFIMRDRLTHANLQTNPHAAYLFIEEGGGYRGKRLFLTRLREEQNSDLIATLSRRMCAPEKERRQESKFLVYFKIDKVLPLIGAEK